MATDGSSNLKTWVQRDFGLDKRLVKAVSKLGFVYPTQVQAQFIPIALQGKDVLVRSQTGSGKTAAFSLPVLQKILLAKAAGAKGASIRAIILAPTKELCRQIEKHATDLMYYCRDSVSVCSLGDDNASAVSYKLQSKPDILVATPAKLVQHLKSSVVDISTVETLVIDEADLILSFGYAEDVQLITSRMPKIFQGLLMSATLSPELDKFKRVVLHNPAVLKISDSKGSGQLLQFYLDSTENDKFLILYVFIKLGLLQGKGLIFVNDVSKCYRLKLFLQQFYIPAAVLNSEVPLNSRLHILEEYNRGVFDYLIATDASIDAGEVDDEEEGEESGAEEEGDENSDSDSEKSDDAMSEEEEEPVKVKSSKSKKLSVDPAAAAASVAASASQSNKGEGYGVSRGIDFQGVNFVINFDLPKTAAAYTHRIGRTARGGASGTALSFVAMAPPTSSASEAEVAARDAEVLHTVRLTQPRLGGGQDGAGSVLAAIGAVPVHDPAMSNLHDNGRDVDLSNCQPAPLVFNMKELDSFRYRVEETLRSVTGVAVREFRAAELKQEILNSAKLKSYFAENPDDLKVLRHDTSVAHPIRPKEHLRNVPTYLIPASMRGAATVTNTKKKKRKLGSAQNSQDAKRQKSKSKDPLQSFDVDADSTPADTNAAPAAEPKVFTSGEALGHSISGRQEWKQRHKKGKFNPKNKSKNPGIFTKTRRDGYK